MIAKVDYEFPSLIAGSVGLVMTLILAKYKIGLANQTADKINNIHDGAPSDSTSYELPKDIKTRQVDISKASFPICGTLLVLIVTRLPDLGIKSLLTSVTPGFSVPLGALGEFSLSAAMVFQLNGIFGTAESWTHALLYVPSILPFVVISALAMKWINGDLAGFSGTLQYTIDRMKLPSVALFGALIVVSLMMMGGKDAPVQRIGEALANVSGSSWALFAPFLGALGSFFSGSATISNLTFGAIQDSIATNLNLDRYTSLALQSVDGALGNMVCINNIVAVCSVLGLDKSEGKILRKTVLPMSFYGISAGLLAFLLF